MKEKDGTKVNDKHIRVEIARGPRPGKEEGGRGGGYHGRGAPWPPHSNDNDRHRGGRRDDDDHYRRRYEDDDEHVRRRHEDDEGRGGAHPPVRVDSPRGGYGSRVSDGLYRGGGVYGDTSRRRRRSPSYGPESGDDVSRSLRGGRGSSPPGGDRGGARFDRAGAGDREQRDGGGGIDRYDRGGYREREYPSTRGGRGEGAYGGRDEGDYRRRGVASDDDGARAGAGTGSSSHRSGMGGSGVGRYYRRSLSRSPSRSRTPPRSRGANDGLGMGGGPPMGTGIVGGSGVTHDSRDRLY